MLDRSAAIVFILYMLIYYNGQSTFNDEMNHFMKYNRGTKQVFR